MSGWFEILCNIHNIDFSYGQKNEPKKNLVNPAFKSLNQFMIQVCYTKNRDEIQISLTTTTNDQNA